MIVVDGVIGIRISKFSECGLSPRCLGDRLRRSALSKNYRLGRAYGCKSFLQDDARR